MRYETAVGLQQKLEHQKRLKELIATMDQRRKDLFVAQDEVEAQREKLIVDIEATLKQRLESTTLFTIRLEPGVRTVWSPPTRKSYFKPMKGTR